MSGFEEVNLLLDVVEKAAKHGPQFSAIAADATAELKKINDEAIKGQQARAKAEADEAAKVKAAESKRIFPAGSGVQEASDPPPVQRKV